MKLRKRHRLRRKEIKALADALTRGFGCQVFGIDDTVDVAQALEYDVVFVDGEALAIVVDGTPCLSVKGLLRYDPTTAFVEVDMGAISFVINGADIMAPGVVATSEDIRNDDMVWIRDQRNKKPLAVGKALMEGKEMVSSKKGKAVRSIHYYGDDLWSLEQ